MRNIGKVIPDDDPLIDRVPEWQRDWRNAFQMMVDAGAVKDYAKKAMGWAVDAGLINGIGNTLKPAGDANRAQVATILMRFMTL